MSESPSGSSVREGTKRALRCLLPGLVCARAQGEDIARGKMWGANVNSWASGTPVTPKRLVFSWLRPLPLRDSFFPPGVG